MSERQPPPLVLHVIHHLVIGGMENGLVNLINRMPAQRFRHAVPASRTTRTSAIASSPKGRGHRAASLASRHLAACGATSFASAAAAACESCTRAISRASTHCCQRGSRACRRRVHGEHGWDVDDLDGPSLEAGAAASPAFAAGRPLRHRVQGPRALSASARRHSRPRGSRRSTTASTPSASCRVLVSVISPGRRASMTGAVRSVRSVASSRSRTTPRC